MNKWYHYVVTGITLCRCAGYSYEVKLQQIEHSSNSMVIMFDKFPAKQLDTLQLKKGVFYYKDTALVSQLQNFQPIKPF